MTLTSRPPSTGPSNIPIHGQGPAPDIRSVAEDSDIDFASMSSAPPAFPSVHSSAPSIRSRKSFHNYANDEYVLEHLNDPNYTYGASIEDIKQTPDGIWPRSSDSNRNSYPMVDKTNLEADKEPPERDDANTSPYEVEQHEDYWEDDSPYPEVRAAVANTDDPTMPTNTFRMWLLGITFTIFIAGMNQFFSLRYPSVTITALVAQLIALPAGKLLERLLPSRSFTTFGYSWTLNPGPWNIKEHTLVTVMANVVSGGAYATEIIAAQRTFYDQHWSAVYQLCLVISSQLIGFSLAGICRRFLVWPAAMIWPETLVNAALFNTMHSMYLDEEEVDATSVEEASTTNRPTSAADLPRSRWSSLLSWIPFVPNTDPSKASHPRFIFFSRALALATIWSVVPSYLFTALSQFTPLCWIYSGPPISNDAAPILPPFTSIHKLNTTASTSATTLRYARQSIDMSANEPTIPRKNIIINQLFGYNSGLGMGLFTFDWAMIAYEGSPLVTPWWAEVNVLITLVVVFWIIAPVMYYSNAFYSQYLPMSSNGSYDNRGLEYDPRRIVVDGIFQEELYVAYSPLYISVTFVLSYGLSFGALTATFVHTWLWYRRDIWRFFKSTLKDSSQEDIHARLMLAYPEVPQWWYAVVGVVAFILGCVTIQVWDTRLPFWAYALSIAIALIYLVPIGMIQAITNMQVGLNVITELIVGYALPGHPVAMMIFKTFGYITMAQALSFVGDLKLGHYMKIPPRIMFVTQTVAALVACFVVVGVQGWMFENIPGLCESDQPDKFTCPGVRVFSTASLIWGGIGPSRAFNHGSLYYPTLFFFIIGAILPVPFYYLAHAFPRSWFKYVNIPVAFTGIGDLPPASGINYSSWALVGFIFQYWIRRFHFRWWSRYNYILSAALDAGVAIGTILVFFTLVYPRRENITLQWWGNTVNDNTPDSLGTPLRLPPDGNFFGIREWS